MKKSHFQFGLLLILFICGIISTAMLIKPGEITQPELLAAELVEIHHKSFHLINLSYGTQKRNRKYCTSNRIFY